MKKKETAWWKGTEDKCVVSFSSYKETYCLETFLSNLLSHRIRSEIITKWWGDTVFLPVTHYVVVSLLSSSSSRCTFSDSSLHIGERERRTWLELGIIVVITRRTTWPITSGWLAMFSSTYYFCPIHYWGHVWWRLVRWENYCSFRINMQ